jgi:chorismate synthase
MPRVSPALRGGALALLAAALFGLSTPLVQRFGQGLGPFSTAALLYTGAALVALFQRRGAGVEAPLRRSDAPRLLAMVAAGAVARKWLQAQHGLTVTGWMTALGEVEIPFEDEAHIPHNPFFAPNASQIPALEAFMDALRKSGDSCGARIRVVARGVPAGLGEPLYDKLDADIAYAMMGINAVKAVEIGDGLAVVAQRGSLHGDELTPEGFASNHAGGVLGGISTGQDIVVSIAIKPTSSIISPRDSIDIDGQPLEVVAWRKVLPAWMPMESPWRWAAA